MSRLILTPALLLLWNCGPAQIPPRQDSPSPSSFRLRLQPARYTQVTGNQYAWELSAPRKYWISGEVEFHGSGRHQFIPGPEDCVTLSYEGRPRYLFHEESGILRISLIGEHGIQNLATLPLDLKAGMTWSSTRTDEKGLHEQTATCKAVDSEFQVAFLEENRPAHSMWFSPKKGLVRWESIESSPLWRNSDDEPSALLRQGTQAYTDFGRVDDDLRNAATDCKAPLPPQPRMSASRDEATHGRKQYFLYAKDRLAYLHAKDLDQPNGQVIVKESWVKQAKGPLFLMIKHDGEWIYATATPDGKDITASGKLASCMECHESASTRDRMFGLTSCAAAK